MPKKRANGEGDVCERRRWRIQRGFVGAAVEILARRWRPRMEAGSGNAATG